MKNATVKKIFILLCWFAAGRVNISAAEPTKPCLSLEPAEVRLTGIIKREEFTNTDDPGEQPGTYWILHLPNAVCVEKGDSEFLDTNVTVNRIQLVFFGNEYKKFRNLVNKSVVASGTLFAAITAHHHTPILLAVKKLKKNDK